MSHGEGMVLHPERQPLHGITVVVETHGPRTYIGRFDVQDDRGVHLINVAVHEASEGTPEEFVARSRRFGVRVTQKHHVVPSADVRAIAPLGQMPS